MSKLLRVLAGVCLLIGIFTAIDVLSGRRHVFEAATWFILEFVLLWSQEGPSPVTAGRHPAMGARRPSSTPSYVRFRGAHRLRQHEQGSTFSVWDRGQR